MIANLDRNGPLRIVDICKMTILLGNFFSFLQDLLIVKFGVVSAFKVQHPALDLLTLGMNINQLFQLIDHPKVLSPKRPLNWQYSMAKPCDFSTFFMNLFHDFCDYPQRIYLSEDWIDFDEDYTLDNGRLTLTLVSICINNLAFAFLLYATSVSRVISLPSYFMRLWMCSWVTSL